MEEEAMQARMTNPAKVLTDGVKVGQNLAKVAYQGGVEQETLELVHLRVSQINGCSMCVSFEDKDKRATDRFWLVSAWQEAPCYTDAERAALALAESITRIAD